ncbi:MAG: AbrB/MazE/SpoVT family DNA-binding domain-containing protein [Nanoarchaeota archaeon]
MEISSLSSKGQIVIPESIRNKLNLKSGDKFIIIGEEDTVLLKRLEMPSFKGVDRILKKAGEESIDISVIIEKARKEILNKKI